MSANHIYSTDPKLPNFRTVIDDDGSFITISQEHSADVKGHKKKAPSVISSAMDLTPTEATWLYGKLGELLAARRGKP